MARAGTGATGHHGASRPAPGWILAEERLNRAVAVCFVLGSGFFVLGAVLAELTAAGVVRCALVYLTGGVLFAVGAWGGFLGCVNYPGPASGARHWRWWAYRPMRIDWCSALLLLGGAWVFCVNLVDSLMRGLSAQQTDRLVWAPDMIGCTLFLVSGQLAVHQVRRAARPARGPAWWTAVINQAGAVLFMVAALADYTRDATGSPVNVHIANWATLGGAVCFLAGGVAQWFVTPAGVAGTPGSAERPGPA
ncbi:hypothetical protein [Streptomyces lonarensis]|uniref:Uncharacterized protein n=1 Tax=Streptomyces lonarensis TaxID=700599 RepID=A0A7X6D4Q8_9ACTN|nr:hypothetical protein [Streptomyces lonarensis]NJQ08148.1 hypothetical protein [Streptomyces lonarensis]